jgi:hypothetical protein
MGKDYIRFLKDIFVGSVKNDLTIELKLWTEQ